MKRTSRAKTLKSLHRLIDGPWEGHSIALDSSGDGKTAWLQIGGKTGRYEGSRWYRAEA